MANAGTITGNLVLRPDDYLQNLNRAADATQKFSRQVSGISFQGFNRGIIATTTLLYGMNRIMSSMSKGMEDFSNVLARIGAVADLTAGSVQQLSESMKGLSKSYGVGRTDIMKGMYSIAQSRFTDPREMRSMAGAAAHLSLASGKEINVHKSADLLSVARQALGIGVDAISSRRMTDILLKGRDIGRWELDQMAAALGIPMTIYGNQFSGRLGGEETLRQLLAIMSTATLAGIAPARAATGTRRLVERTVQLSKGGRVSQEFTQALRGAGFGGENPILEALNQGPMAFLNTLVRLTGGRTEDLSRFGFGSRDLMVLTSAMRGRGSELNRAYQDLAYGGISGTTERYAERMRGTYGYTRDKLRAEWEITSQEFMKASIPLIGSFTEMLSGLNRVAQALPTSLKTLAMLSAGLVSLRYALNLFGFKGSIFGISSQRMTGGGDRWTRGMMGAAGVSGVSGVSGIGGSGVRSSVATQTFTRLGAEEAYAARLARRSARAAGRTSTYRSGWGGAGDRWVDPHHIPGMASKAGHMPILTAAQLRQMSVSDGAIGEMPSYKPLKWYRHRGKMYADASHWFEPHGGVPMGPQWHGSPGVYPMNPIQVYNQGRMTARLDAARVANNAFWYSSATGRRRGIHHTHPYQPGWSDRQRFAMLSRYGALGRHFGVSGSSTEGLLSGKEADPMYRASKWGPTTQARIRWAAYQQGKSVDFATGSYGTLSPAAQAFQTRGVPQGTLSPRELHARRMGAENMYMAASAPYRGMMGAISKTGEGMGWGNVGKAAQQTASKMKDLAAGIGGVIAPMAKFMLIMKSLGAVVEGYNTEVERHSRISGRTKITPESYGLASRLDQMFMDPLRLLGAGLHFGEGWEERIRKVHTGMYERRGWEMDPDSSGIGSMWGSFRHGFKEVIKNPMLRTLAIADPGLIPVLALRNAPPVGYSKRTPELLMQRYAREELSPLDVRTLQTKGGVDFGDFGSIRRRLEDWIKEKRPDQLPPDNWTDLVRGVGGAEQFQNLVIPFLKDLANEASGAAKELNAFGIAVRTMAPETTDIGYYANLAKQYSIYTLGHQTIEGLNRFRKSPFAQPKSDEWMAKYHESTSDILKDYSPPIVPMYQDWNVEQNRAKLLFDITRDAKQFDTDLGDITRYTKPFDEVLKLNQRNREIRFLSQHGHELADMDRKRIIQEFNLAGRFSPDVMPKVVDKIRGITPDMWSETLVRPSAPFSSAKYLGSAEGYNATLERPMDMVVRQIPEKMHQILDAITLRQEKVEQISEEFKAQLASIIENGTKPIVSAINSLSPDTMDTGQYPPSF